MKRILSNLLLSAVTCLFLIGIASAPSLSNSAEMLPQGESAPAANTLEMSQPSLDPQSIDQQLMAELREAEAVIAQGVPADSIRRYVAVMTKNGVVVPAIPSTTAFSAAGAVLVGDRLVVRGDFSNLSSTLRDFATDPVDPPNPNITSGIHIHQGEPTANGPFQYAIEVSPGANQISGRFGGEYTLTS
ncbi:MAG: CHRD domain-containing protein, partial [Microcoleus sp. SIO2G3]|nr:CHRD domain-containing protein [Microcoleus sp. SIO2G3]